MSPNQNKATSAGQKVDLGRNAPVTQEGPGKVNSESLAAESNREGGAFAENSSSHSENISSDADSGLRATVKDNAPLEPTRYAKSQASENVSRGSENVSQQSSNAGTAPTYISSQYIKDTSGPHGKNISEGGWDESKAKDGLKAALASEPGSENDPSRLAEMQFQQNQNRGGRDAGPKQGELNNESKYDGLKSDVPA